MDMHTDYAEISSVVAPALDAAAEQRWVLEYAPLVKRIVRQLLAQVSGAMDRDDMEQIGLLGLLEALRRYGEPDRGFGGYAALRVRGAILDELRRQDWRPRTVRQDSHRTRDAVRALTRKLGREPTEAEACKALDISADAFQAHQLAENAETIASFDELVAGSYDMAGSSPSPEEQLMARRSLVQALMKLDEREQRVIQLYYEFELSYKEIAAVLGLTEARICQINKAALKKMKDVLR
ncbi:MAG: FliA/WhiG family RNA polymerase sigma factor [Gammaproteobacteria bacterium]|jgi:RNA polymerase sigma factor FliA|nr:FliA/WhiG family RNA polymerase sigma factor [Gammaproteobacteria bacterium]MBU0773482.1 FliA/WhiG family RNA polymerase sigma factor [Gammaproteobacteria bacterium]MBU0856692.1 FliA/WhiG family RNA polymerase sigma factor [Gammaproteobacteria bacterium]MBU1846778.1 FliA/WhiG family RNA polymerase sigma factor [Gammaproteobacteria bacterium]